VQGETFALTLRFERAGYVTVIARVRGRVDASGIEPLPELTLGDLTFSLGSAPPALGPLSGHSGAGGALGGLTRFPYYPRRSRP
jgi:hypothetical protein